MKVIWLKLAAETLDGIYHYLENLNPRAAVELYNDILDETEKLSVFPQMAAIEPLLGGETDTFRSLVVRHRYKVVYFIEDETVKVADIWDCRQAPEALKKRVTR
jgi:plasmid stabilization system protein ParE